jgi:YfiH family protein
MRQVHGNDVRALGGERDQAPECDGLVTDRPGAGLVVQTADCVPFLLWAERRNEVAAVHAGWRGTLSGVTSAAVRALASLGARASELHVAVGPAIRVCCFEVGDEVVDAFAGSGRVVSKITRGGSRGRRHLDLVADNRRQLLEAGVGEGRIYDSGRCTHCEWERFYSYRREGASVGRILGAIGVRPVSLSEA